MIQTPSAFCRFAAVLALLAFASLCFGQISTFGGNPQHTGVYTPSAANLNGILWTTTIDENNTGADVHYGEPLISSNNTVFVPVKIAGDQFKVNVFDGATGNLKYTLTSDYVLPSHNWTPEYQPVLTTGPLGSRLYYAGAGGTVYYVDNPDTATPGAPVREVFYTDLATYTAGASGYNSTIFIDTPITADSSGNIFFGFRTQGTAPAPLGTTQSGYARITPSGVGTYVLAGTAASDSNISLDCHNTAPALSNDGTTLYVVVKWNSNAYYAYLLGLNSTTLATKYKVFLLDPRGTGNAGALDDGTASPMVAPDNDVYLGIFGNPYNGSRGFLAHFSPDLTVTHTPGGFGWDMTPGIVPASMVPSYSGPSSYLLFCKYNNYAINDGNGVNRVAILDPNSTQLDPHSSATGLVEMREVMTMIGPSTDGEYYPSFPTAVREWCINACAVNPATNSVLFDSEDGHIYRWNLATNQLSQGVVLTAGIGEPYVPTAIGPDGTVYTLNGGSMFALGTPAGPSLNLTSSAPDATQLVAGTSVTFTATMSNPSIGGTVTFTDLTFNGLTQQTTTLASGVPVDGNGHASVTTSSLAAGGAYFGNHFITATHSGGSTMTLVQKVHQYGTTTTVGSSANPSTYGSSVTFTATVASNPSGGTPGGMVTFCDGSAIIAQLAVDGTGHASYTANGLTNGNHTITVKYASDTYDAASTGSIVQTVQDGTTTTLGSAPNPSTYGQSVTLTAHVTAADSGAGSPAGTVSFADGGVTIGSAPVDGSGNATFSTSSLSVGTHTLTASFVGNPGCVNSNSGSVTQNVQDGTTTSLSSAPNPSTYGQSVTLSAHVTAADSGAGTPTGSVTFSDGASTLGSAPVDGSGNASFSTSSLTVGSHTLSAAFTGSNGWQNSSSTNVSQSVQDGTTTALNSSLNPSNYNQSVTFTATVSAADSGAGTPTGTVTFMDGSTTLGSGPVNGSGQATFSTSTLSVGSHSISASFAGSGGWQNSTSSSVSQQVQDGTSTTLSNSPNPSTYGQSVTLTAHVTATDSGAGTPTGNVTFSDGSTSIGTAAVDGSGNATFNTSTLSVGTHTLSAAFTGSNGWQNSSSSSQQQSVQDGTTTSLISGLNPSTYGQSVTFTATVTAVDSGAGTPTGTVTFKDGATTLGSSPVNGSGQAAFSTSTLSVGSHSISASFAGSGGWQNSGSGTVSQSVQDGTSTSVGSSANPSNYSSSVTFTATVTANDSGAGTPTGTVTFMDGATTLGSAPVNGSGQASFSTSSLSIGSHSITASFAGTNGWQNSSSSTLSQLVQDGTSTSVGSSLNPSFLGQNVTFTATVTAAHSGAGTPSGFVTFLDNGTTMATVPVDGTGHASTSTSSLTGGSHTITASFAGNTGWLNSSGQMTQTVNTDNTPPSVPSGVSATSGPGKMQITIRWLASTDPDDAVANYRVYRSTAQNGTYTLIATVTTLSYVDTVSGRNKTEWYYVVAVDSHGNASAPSAKVTAKSG